MMATTDTQPICKTAILFTSVFVQSTIHGCIPPGSTPGSQLLRISVSSSGGGSQVSGASVEVESLIGMDDGSSLGDVELVTEYLEDSFGQVGRGTTDSDGHLSLDIGCVIIQTGQSFSATEPLGIRITVDDDEEVLVIDPVLGSTVDGRTFTVSVISVGDCTAP